MERSGAGARLIIVRGLPGQPIHQNESEMQKRWLAPFEMTGGGRWELADCGTLNLANAFVHVSKSKGVPVHDGLLEICDPAAVPCRD
jgi:hypothetical protein